MKIRLGVLKKLIRECSMDMADDKTSSPPEAEDKKRRKGDKWLHASEDNLMLNRDAVIVEPEVKKMLVHYLKAMGLVQ